MIGTVRKVAQVLVLACAVLPVTQSGHAASSYEGREAGSRWRQKALERIEKIRKSDFTVEVVDRAGNPLPGAQVTVRMQRHAFGFGSAVTARDLTAQTGDAEMYRAMVERNFNKVVFENDLKWGAWESGQHSGTDSFFSRQNTFAALRWLNERGIAVRGHCVVWASLEGEGGIRKYRGLPPAQFRTALLSHAEEKVLSVGSLVTEWDVVNHPIGWGKGNLAELFGTPFYDEVFQRVSRWNPAAKRYLNEGDILPSTGYDREQYLDLISTMLSRGAKIDGIGFMGHFKGDRTLEPPEQLLETFDRFAKFRLPLQVTEFDVSFGKEMNKPFPLTAQQEALQADYLRDFLIAAFSHPAVEGVVMWGFWEGRHSFPDAALYRRDWSPKPNGKAWEDLVLGEWWSSASGASDRAGRFASRCFLGSYRVEVSRDGRRKVLSGVELKKEGARLRVVLD